MRLPNVHVKGLGKKVGRKGVLELGILEANVRDEGLLPKDVVEVPLVPDVLVGEILRKEAVALVDGHEVKGHLLILHG